MCPLARFQLGKGTDVALARIREGDLDALALVMDAYQARLLRFLVRLVKDRR